MGSQIDYEAVLARCMRRIGNWRTPPNYSSSEWLKEVKAQSRAAAWQAIAEFNELRGVPMEAFIYIRVLASARTRYRQEWSFSIRSLSAEEQPERMPPSHDTLPQFLERESLQSALGTLGPQDQFIIVQLFWNRCSETEVARPLGISHQAVNKRKQTILAALRRSLKA